MAAASDRAFRNVAALRDALREGTFGLDYAPKFLRIALVEETWKRFTSPDGKIVVHDVFEDFVTKPPFEGLGLTVDALRRVVRIDEKVLAMLEKALEGKPVPRPRDYGTAVQQSLFTPTSPRMLRNFERLRDASKALHGRVSRGELTLYEAMIEAGLRDRTLTLRPGDIDATARALKARLSSSDIGKLKKLL